eukprot:3395230-Amphidinium_carterae.1
MLHKFSASLGKAAWLLFSTNLPTFQRLCCGDAGGQPLTMKAKMLDHLFKWKMQLYNNFDDIESTKATTTVNMLISDGVETPIRSVSAPQNSLVVASLMVLVAWPTSPLEVAGWHVCPQTCTTSGKKKQSA